MLRLTVFTTFLFCSLWSICALAKQPKQVSIKSEIMAQERRFNVGLPDDYAKHKQKRYPVVYQLQSSDTFLAAYSAVDNLTATGQMPDVILVGIEHRDKFSELSIDSAESDAFYRHLTEELMPYLQEHYRVEQFSVLSGWSVGGGFVVHKMMQSAPFDGFLAYSPALTFELNQSAYKASVEKLLANNGFLILSVGNEEGEFSANFGSLIADSQKYTSNFYSKKHGDFDHRGNAFISQFYGFTALFKGWAPSQEIVQSGFEALQLHYHNLSKKYGFVVQPPKEVLLFSAYSVLAGDTKQSLERGSELVSYTLQQFPETRTEFQKMAAFLLSQERLVSHQALQTLLQSP